MNILRAATLILVTFIAFQHSSAQGAKVMKVAEYMPSLEGCQTKKDSKDRRRCTMEKIDEAMATSLKLTSEAKKSGEGGTAVISLTVNPDGSIAVMDLVDDPGYGMGAAALKAMKKLSKSWYPAEHLGEKVTAEFKIPVTYTIPEEEEEPAPVAKPDVYKVVETMPAFGDCKAGDKQCSYTAVLEYLSENMKYPPTAKTAGLEGVVKTSFVIDTEGNVTDVKVVEGIGSGCDEEAVRLVSEMPAWKPGMQDGEAVKVAYDLPVRFQVRGKE